MTMPTNSTNNIVIVIIIIIIIIVIIVSTSQITYNCDMVIIKSTWRSSENSHGATNFVPLIFVYATQYVIRTQHNQYSIFTFSLDW